MNISLVVSTPTQDFGPYLFAGPNTGAAKPMPGFVGELVSYLRIIGAGVSVQVTGLLPGTGIDHTQNTFSSSALQDVFNITVNPEAVGERGVLQAIFTGPQTTHEIDVPVYVLPQPQMFIYAAPVTVQQGSSSDLVYESADTSVNPEQMFLGTGWPSTILLNPGTEDSNPSLVYGIPVELAGAYSVKALGTAPAGGSTLPLEFAVDNLTQVVQVPLQVDAGNSQPSSATDFSLNFTPQALTIEAGTAATLSITETAINAPSFTHGWCTNSYNEGPFTNAASVSAPLPLGTGTAQSVNLCSPQPVNINVPQDTPPGNYELTVKGTVDGGFSLYNPSNPGGDPWGPITSINASHLYGVPVTVTAAVAPTPSITLSPSQSEISLTAGQSFPITIMAQGNNGFSGSILVSASSVPAGVVVSPASFSLAAGSSQPVTVLCLPFRPPAGDFCCSIGRKFGFHHGLYRYRSRCAMNCVNMHSHGVNRWSLCVLLVCLPTAAQLGSPAAAAKPAVKGAARKTGACTVRQVNYRGWKATELANPWVKLYVVPGDRRPADAGEDFGGHDLLYIDPKIAGHARKFFRWVSMEAAIITTEETRSIRCRREARMSSTGRASEDIWIMPRIR